MNSRLKLKLYSTIENKGPKAIYLVAVVLIFIVISLLFAHQCSASETSTLITSESLEIISSPQKFIARGSVRVEKDGATIIADEMTYYDETSEGLIAGNIRYDDIKAAFTADKAELNMDRKTGKLYNAEIFFKQDHSYLSGGMIEKKGENEYYIPENAKFTTCDGIPAAWCLKGRDVDLIVGDRIRSRETSFLIRDIPVLYTPYLWAPALTKRTTGLLIPQISNSSSKGFGLNIPFYWAISENKDATFIFDYFSKRGIGTGIEYRVLDRANNRSYLWTYHIRDTYLNRDFAMLRALHEKRLSNGLSGFLDINVVNQKDFYRHYNPQNYLRGEHFIQDIASNYGQYSQRFINSTGELNFELNNSRSYLLSQYWIDLRDDTGDVPQKLPEIGYVLRYSKIGNFYLSTNATASNIWRDDGISALRMDIYPKVLHSLGKDFVVSQMLALRGTLYSLYNDDVQDSSIQRTALEYGISGYTRLFKQYSSFTHVIEPTIGYHFISSSENGLLIFDEVEFYKKRSVLEASILNRFLSAGKEVAALKITQGFDMLKSDNHLLPLEINAGMAIPFPIKAGVTYDLHEGQLETATSDVAIPLANATTITFGQRYSRLEDTLAYNAGIAVNPAKGLFISTNMTYNASGEGLSAISVSLKYQAQCWGVRIEAIKKPNDFTIRFLFDLLGVT